MPKSKYKDNPLHQQEIIVNETKRKFGNDSNELYKEVHKLVRMFLQSRRSKTYLSNAEFEPFAKELAEILVLQNMKGNHIESWVGYMLVCHKSKLYLWRQEHFSNSLSIDELFPSVYKGFTNDNKNFYKYENLEYMTQNISRYIDYYIQFFFFFKKGSNEFIKTKNLILLNLIIKISTSHDLFLTRPFSSKNSLRYKVLINEVLTHVSRKFI